MCGFCVQRVGAHTRVAHYDAITSQFLGGRGPKGPRSDRKTNERS